MKKVFIIFKHEFKEITKGKMFLIMTFLGPLLFGAITILPSYLAMKSFKTESNSSIAVLVNDTNIFNYANEMLQTKELSLVRVETEDEGKDLVIKEKAKGYISIPDNIMEKKSINYFSSTGTDFQYSNEVEKVLRDYIYGIKIKTLGLSSKDSKWLSDSLEIKSMKLTDSGDVDDSDYESVLFISMAMSILIMMTVIIYGISTGRSVLSEKTNKTIEILLSSVKPFQILLGKVLGSGAAGLLQFTVWISMAVAVLKLVIPVMKIDIPDSILVPSNLVIIVIYFILGFFFYLFIYAAIGANVENEQNLGQVQIPMQLLIMAPIMMSSALISNPNGIISKVFSYLPFTSPTVMNTRVLIDSPGILMVIVSMLILLASLVIVLFGSAKIFRVGILTKGQKVNLVQLLKYLVEK